MSTALPQRLPTRVSNACDRCRSQKQRCDFFRPCSNCLHSKTRCSDENAPPAKKRRVTRKRKKEQDAEHEGASPTQDQSDGQKRRKSSSASSQSAGEGSNHSHHGVPDEPHADAYPSPKPSGAGSYEDMSSVWSSNPVQRSMSPSATDFGEADSAIRMTRKILGEQLATGMAARATFAIPGSDAYEAVTPSKAGHQMMSVADLLGFELPPRPVCDTLLNSYFFTVHWFSLVVYEPKFRARYTRIMDTGLVARSDHGFLLLLLMVLTMGCWYGSKDRMNDEAANQSMPRWENMGNTFLKPVREQFMDIMDEDSLDFVQMCTLLGSFYLYHGRPRSSFSILGAATKSSQAMGLHRDCGQRFSYEDTEERKRVWWTVYTWDRFATIIYGRPLGINDKDCNVTMPSDYKENINFGQGLPAELITLSTYQTHLNKSYQIASPIIENIFGIRTSKDVKLRAQLPAMVAEADRALQEWRQALPPQFSFENAKDISENSTTEEKMHQLQRLALELTYNNLIIVIHRPLLADQRAGLSRFRQRVQQQQQKTTSPGEMPHELNYPSHHGDLSFKRCLDSALAISQVESRRNLLMLARRTHLVAFLGINLFTSSVVMSICALSDTLSDVAQEAKRGMARTLQMQKLLSPYASLSLQSSTILEDLVKLILRKESMEMLRVEGDEAAKESIRVQMGALAGGGSPNFTLASPNGAAFDDASSRLYTEDAQLNESLLSLQKVFQDNSASMRPPPQFTQQSQQQPWAGLGATPGPYTWQLMQQHQQQPQQSQDPQGQTQVPVANASITSPHSHAESSSTGLDHAQHQQQQQPHISPAPSWLGGPATSPLPLGGLDTGSAPGGPPTAPSGGAAAGGGFEIDDLGQFWLWNLEPFH